jgi:GDPmannose 4,6-dehydratase
LNFVSQKIAHAAASVSLGILNSSETDERGQPIVRDGKVLLGSLDTRRDFGFAGDYVEAMHAIVTHKVGDDFVVGTGITHSIAEFCDVAFRFVDRNWKDHVLVDSSLIRKADSHTQANPEKLTALLGHNFKTKFEDLVHMMVTARREYLQTKR